MKKQNPILNYACLDTELISGKPPTTYNGVLIRDDSICEVMNTNTFEIFDIYKMNNGKWYEYVVGESPNGDDSEYQEWVGFPDTPVKSVDYPSQVIVSYNGIPSLWLAKNPIVYNWSSTGGFLNPYPQATQTVLVYILSSGEWVVSASVVMNVQVPLYTVEKCNHNIYNITSGALWFTREV